VFLSNNEYDIVISQYAGLAVELLRIVTIIDNVKLSAEGDEGAVSNSFFSFRGHAASAFRGRSGVARVAKTAVRPGRHFGRGGNLGRKKNFFWKTYLNYLLITISMQLRHYLLNIL
jgi:hypothetical protein